MNLQPPQPSDAWKEAANARIARHRMGELTVRLTDAAGQPQPGRVVEAQLARHAFPWGMAVASDFLGGDSDTSRAYEQVITRHFHATVCENHMKWYAIEEERDRRDFALADRFVDFSAAHRLPARGHCLLWSKTWWVQPWLRYLPAAELRARTLAHITETVSRYRGRLIAWDVNNELIDGNFYEERLGPGTNAEIFRTAHAADPSTPLFLNEYTVLQDDRRLAAYVRLVDSLRDQGAPVHGLGIQEHDAHHFLLGSDRPGRDFHKLGYNEGQLLIPDQVLARLDRLHGATGLPIHITEVTSATGNEQRRAQTLVDFMRLCFSHPAVEAFLLWGFWSARHFRGRDAALVDADWKITPAGHAVFDLLGKEFHTTFRGTTDAQGEVTFRGFYGDYALAGVPQPVPLRRGQTSATVVVP